MARKLFYVRYRSSVNAWYLVDARITPEHFYWFPTWETAMDKLKRLVAGN